MGNWQVQCMRCDVWGWEGKLGHMLMVDVSMVSAC